MVPNSRITAPVSMYFVLKSEGNRVNLKLSPIICLLSVPVAMLGGLLVMFGLLDIAVFNDGAAALFFRLGGACLAGSALTFLLMRQHLQQFIFREAFLLVALTWLVLGCLGSIPFWVTEQLSFSHAVFESVSGLTTTGATMISGLDEQPPTVLLYRQSLQWLGGLGVIVLVVAIMPMLNVGGMKIFKAETPGPMKDEKLTPRLFHSARYLWGIYIFITGACAVSFHLAGMSWYDAIAHSLSTVSTGGFSTHDASLAYFNNTTIEGIADVFMLIGSLNFGLHFAFLKQKRPGQYWRDEETRWFLVIVAGAIILLMCYLRATNVYPTWSTSFRFASFEAISFISTTGFGITEVYKWPVTAFFFLVILAYIGGCAGSTAGGTKVIRINLTLKSIGVSLKKLIHPAGVFTLKFNGQKIDDDVSAAVHAFLFFTVSMSILLTVLMMATGLDFMTAFSAVAACLNVLGPAFGELGSNFQSVTPAGSWILVFTMIFGRLELFTLLVLCLPSYWSS